MKKLDQVQMEQISAGLTCGGLRSDFLAAVFLMDYAGAAQIASIYVVACLM